MSPPPLVPAMRGAGVILARLRREDIPSLAAYFQNLELTTYLGGSGVAYSLEDEQAYFERVSRSGPDGVTLGIYEAGSERLIGGVDLRDINHRHGTAELGVSLHDPASWGRGLGREATLLMVAYGMFHLGLHNIMLRVYAFNERAVRAYLGIGFREIGRRRGSVRLGQERFDTVFMDITAAEVDTSALRRQIRLLP